jgi:hypothetical protein
LVEDVAKPWDEGKPFWTAYCVTCFGSWAGWGATGTGVVRTVVREGWVYTGTDGAPGCGLWVWGWVGRNSLVS